jgi:hypothetical protein
MRPKNERKVRIISREPLEKYHRRYSESGPTSFISFGNDPTRGTKTDVGQIQAAFDVYMITEYAPPFAKWHRICTLSWPPR